MDDSLDETITLAPPPASKPPAPPEPPAKKKGPVLHRLEAIAGWLGGAGFELGWIHRVLYWWKQFGIVKMLGVAIAVFMPLMKFEVLPHLASRTVSAWAEGFDDPDYRVPNKIQTASTREALAEAPPVIRAVATIDEKQSASKDDEITSAELSHELAAMGISPDDVERANAFVRGARKVKSGFKRLVD